MAVRWDAGMYLEMIKIYERESKKLSVVNGSKIHAILQNTREETFHKSSVIKHWSMVRRMAKMVASMDKDLSLTEYNEEIKKITKTDIVSFSEKQIAPLREFGASIAEKDITVDSTSLFKKKDPVLGKTVTESDANKIDPRVQRAIMRTAHSMLSQPLADIVSQKLDSAINSVLTPRIINKIVNTVSEQVSLIFVDELKAYHSQQQRAAKRPRVEESDDEEDEEDSE
jgi:hypothetical protein